MSQSGFEMFSNVAGMVIVIADVIFFYALWNIFYKNKKEKMTMMAGGILLILNIGLGCMPKLPTSGRLIISAVIILIYSIARYKRHCEKAVFILTLFYGFRSLSFLISDSVYQYLGNFLYGNLDIYSETYYEQIYLYGVYTHVVFDGLYIGLLFIMTSVLWKVIVPVNKMSWYDVCFL